MAVTTSYKKQEQTANNVKPISSTSPYQGMNGVSQNTANNLGNYQQGYKQSDAVTQAQQTLQNVQANKPQGYNSKYSGALESILQQVQNPKEFKYEFNGDNLFKAYADRYAQMGKQASLDAQGQAAGLTGGYGNSYGQQVGQQTYNSYLQGLYDKGLELYDRAYQGYQDEQANLQNRYSVLQSADASDYGRYRDTVADWQQEEAQAYDRYTQADESDYNRYLQGLDYWTGLAQVENAAYNTEADRQEAIREYEQNFAENQRQFNVSMDENVRQFNEKMAEDTRQFNESLAEQKRQEDLDEKYRRDELAERARQYDASLAEQIREADMQNAYQMAALAQAASQFDRQLAAQIQQAADEAAYRQQALAQSQAQFEAQQAWQREQFEAEQAANAASEDKSLAYKYAMGVLGNGQMPSDDLLAAAGLSAADAASMIAQAEPTVSYVPTQPAATGGEYTAIQMPDGSFAKWNGNKYVNVSQEKMAEDKPNINTTLKDTQDLMDNANKNVVNAVNNTAKNATSNFTNDLSSFFGTNKKKK